VVSHNKCDFPVNTPLLAAGIIYLRPGVSTPSKPKPRAAQGPKRIDKIVNLDRTQLKRRLYVFGVVSNKFCLV